MEEIPYSTDYIPKNDAVFDNWFKNLVDYVIAKTSGEAPEWTHIPAGELTLLSGVYAAYLPTLKPRSFQICVPAQVIYQIH